MHHGLRLLSFIDVLIDGPYIKEHSDPFNLKWKGSSNQRLWKKIKGVWVEEDEN